MNAVYATRNGARETVTRQIQFAQVGGVREEKRARNIPV